MSDYKWFWNMEIGDTITCPYCEKEYIPSYDETCIGDEPVSCYEDGFSDEFVCDRCHKKFKLTCEMKWVYETNTIDGQMTREEWEEL